MMSRLMNRAVDYTELSAALKAQLYLFTDLSTSYWGYNAMIEASHTHTFDNRDANNNEYWTAITENGINAPYNQ